MNPFYCVYILSDSGFGSTTRVIRDRFLTELEPVCRVEP